MKINTCKAAGKRIALAGLIAISATSTVVKAEIDISELGYDLPKEELPVSNIPPEKSATGFGVGALLGGAIGGPVGIFFGGVSGVVIADNQHNQAELQATEEKLQKVSSQLEIAQYELKNAKMILKQQEEMDSIKYASMQNDLMRYEEVEFEHNQAMKAVSEGFTMAVQFRSGSFEIENHYKAQLKKLASSLNVLSNVEVELNGYTDPRGETVPNLELSRKRVEQVKQVLVEAGVNKTRISASSIGEGELMCKLEDTKGYQFERRVEINFRFTSDVHEGNSVNGAKVAQN
mgnify:CR=1 FL=1